MAPHRKCIPVEVDNKMPCVQCGVNMVDTTTGDLICKECNDKEEAEEEETDSQLYNLFERSLGYGTSR